MRKTVVAIFLLVAFAASASAQMNNTPPMNRCADCSMQGPEMGNMDRMTDMMGMCLANADKIGLSDEQIKKITPIHHAMQKKQIRYKADLKIAQMEQMEIMEVKDFDVEKAAAAAKKIADLKVSHQMDMLKSIREVRGILTEDQFAAMKRMMPMRFNGGGKPDCMLQNRQ